MKKPDYSFLYDRSNEGYNPDSDPDVTQALADRLAAIENEIEKLDSLIAWNDTHFHLYGDTKTIDRIRAAQDHLGKINSVYYNLVKGKVLANNLTAIKQKGNMNR